VIEVLRIEERQEIGLNLILTNLRGLAGKIQDQKWKINCLSFSVKIFNLRFLWRIFL